MTPNFIDSPNELLQIHFLSVQSIIPSSVQPRREFGPTELADLAASIQSVGILQPILVKKVSSVTPPCAPLYEIIAGERRWRAVQLISFTQIPAIILPPHQKELKEIALIENLQRVELTPLEIAYALQQLATEHSLTQEELSQRIGKKRSTVANYLRLLGLPPEIKNHIKEKQITFAHAKAILALSDDQERVRLAQKIISEGLTSRQTEVLVTKIKNGIKNRPSTPVKNSTHPLNAELLEITQRLEEHLGTKVHISPLTKTSGKIELSYYSLDDFETLLEKLGILTEEQKCL